MAGDGFSSQSVYIQTVGRLLGTHCHVEEIIRKNDAKVNAAGTVTFITAGQTGRKRPGTAMGAGKAH
jgi:hypothetical protein